MWFTLASVLFNLLVLPRADVKRTTHVSWKSSVTHEAASYQQTLLHMACSSAPVLHHTRSLPALSAATQSEGVWCVLWFVRHFSTGEMLPRVTLFLGQSMHSGVTASFPQRLLHVNEMHSSSLRRAIKLSSTGMVRIWYTPKRYIKIFHSQNRKWPYKVIILAFFPRYGRQKKKVSYDCKITFSYWSKHFCVFCQAHYTAQIYLRLQRHGNVLPIFAICLWHYRSLHTQMTKLTNS